MAKQHLKIARKSLNPYEDLYKKVSSKPLFVQEDWVRSAKDGTLDAYASALLNSDNVDITKYIENYDADYANSFNRISALYNEVGSDRTNVDQKRTRNVYDENGNIKTSPSGEPIVEEFTASDYEYNKMLIKTANTNLHNIHAAQVQEELKASRGGLEKFLFNTAAIPSGLLYGFVKGMNDLTSFASGLKEASAEIMSPVHGGVDDAMLAGMNEDSARILQFAEDGLLEFEKRYTSMRDKDGNYTNLGKYIGGISSTLGQLVSSILIGKGAGAAAGGAGATAKTAGTVAKVTSQTVFYAGMTAGNVRDMYHQFALNNVSVPAATILANASIKSVLQWAVEIGLGKLLGGSALDNIVFGRRAAQLSGKTLAVSGAKRLGHDMLTEGLEEVFQETSDFLVDRGFMLLGQENFGQITNLTWQSLFDAFVIGGIASFAGSAGKIIGTKRVATLNAKTNSKGELIKDKDGNIVFERLDKLSSWEYGLSMSNFVENYNTLMEVGKDVKQGTKAAEQYKVAATEMYAAYRMISSIYGEIGAERFEAADIILKAITDKINEGKFDNTYLQEAATKFVDELEGLHGIQKEAALKKILEAQMTKIEKTVTKEEVKKKPKRKQADTTIDKILNNDEKLEQLVITKDGIKPVKLNEKTVAIPEQMINNTTPETIQMSLAEQTLVENVVHGKYPVGTLDVVLATYKEVSGNDTADMSQVVMALLFDDNFFKVVLVKADRDVYQLLTSLHTMMTNIVAVSDNADLALKNKIAATIENKKGILLEFAMYTETDYTAFIEIYDSKERAAIIRKIEAMRWSNNLYARVVNGDKLTDADKNVLNQRIDNISDYTKDQKDKLRNELFSTSSDRRSRTRAMNRVVQGYKNVHLAKYDSQNRLPLRGVANTVFNNFADELGLRVDQILDERYLTDSDIATISQTGKVDDAAIIKFRQRQFNTFTNGRFSFAQTRNQYGDVVTKIYDSRRLAGYGEYAAKSSAIYSGSESEMPRTHVNVTYKRNDLVRKLLDDSVDIATASYLSIHDVISDPSLLSEDIQLEIIEKYNDISSDSVFLYLRNYFIKTLKNTTVIILQDGTYAFGTIKSMQSVLKNKDVVITKDMQIGDIIKKSHLNGMLGDIKIVFTSQIADAASYEPFTYVDGVTTMSNTIYVSEDLLNDQDYLKFALLHEFQHAVQFANKINTGIGSNWTSHFPQATVKKMVEDLSAAKPEIFNKAKTYMDKVKVLESFVYNTSGESTAMGLDASELVDFYPTLVFYTDNKMKIQLPTGNTYSANISPLQSLVLNTVSDGAYQILNRAEYADYFKYSAMGSMVTTFMLQSKSKDLYRQLTEVPEVLAWIRATMGYSDKKNSELKKELFDVIDTDLKDQMLQLWYQELGFNTGYNKPISYDEFLEMDMPYVRIQQNDNINNDYFISAYSGLDIDRLVTEISGFVEKSGIYRRNYTLFVDTIKPKDIVGYVGTSLNEVLLSTEAIKSAKRYEIDVLNRQVLTVKESAPITQIADESNYKEDGLYSTLGVMSLARENKSTIDTDVEKIEKPKPKSRRVSKKKAEGTNLDYFYERDKLRGKRTQLDADFQKFIVNAAGDNEVVYELQNKINGTEKGTLTRRDVFDYLRNANKIDDVTFNAINDAFFQNKYLKTFDDLQKMVLDADKYYALRVVLKQIPDSDYLSTEANPALVKNLLEIINQNEEYKALYDSIYFRYSTYKGNPIVISEKYLRRALMQHYDGSIHSAGAVAGAAKYTAGYGWLITGEGSSYSQRSLDDTVGKSKDGVEDMKLEEVIADEDTELANLINDELSNTDRDTKIEEIATVLMLNEAKRLLAEATATGGDIRDAGIKASRKKAETIDRLNPIADTDVIDKEYLKVVKNMTDEQINEFYVKSMVVEATGIDYKELESDLIKERVDIILDNIKVNTDVKTNMVRIAQTIRRNISDKSAPRFLEENSDIFNDDLTLKKEVYQTLNHHGNIRIKSVDKLIPIHERLKKLSKEAQRGAYNTKEAFEYKKAADKQLKKMQKKVLNTLSKPDKKETVKVVAIKGDEIEVRTNKDIPELVKRILNTELDVVAQSQTQYLTNDNDYHVKMNMKTFIENHADALKHMTQADVDEIIDYFLTSEILPNTNRAKLFITVQELMLGYLLKERGNESYIVTKEQMDAIEKRLELMISTYATGLVTWRTILASLKPEELIEQSMLRRHGLEFSDADIGTITAMLAAMRKNDIDTLQKRKAELYDSLLEQHKGQKRHFLEKLLQYERVAMLSSPGTWVRNAVSNVVVKGGNTAGEYIGDKVVNLLMSMFPKTQHRKGQYKLVGTQVTSDVTKFIKTQVIDSGIFELINDGISKYDVRQTKKMTGTDIIVDMIASKIGQEISHKYNINTKYEKFNNIANAAYNFVYKMISDNKFVEKDAIRYFGKILTESKTDLTQGVTNDVLSQLAEAYVLATYNYMHKTNFIMKMESRLRDEVGVTAHFIYKQILPFAGASWNWFMEGLNYTPVGLVKSIINFAKLENTIAKLDNQRKNGERVVSSKFAEYITKRNIGKGVIGSIGLGIGIALAAFGVARIDEEDEKYKLYIGDVGVDISSVFGTQGILLGIATMGAFKNGDNLASVLSATLDQMFIDSSFSEVFNTFRYSESFGDWLMYAPYNMTSMMVPNFLKTFSSIATLHKVNYSKGVKGKIERLIVQAIPGISYAFPAYMDPYTGEKQIPFKAQFITTAINRISPIDIFPYNVTDMEKEAITLGIRKSQLTGSYTINDEKVQLSTTDLEKLNKYYGEHNKKELTAFKSGRVAYKVQTKNGTYALLKYSQMTDKQKATVIDRIMSNNSSFAKTYILTSTNAYKYFASESEYTELKKLGITTNVYKANKQRYGYVKIT